MSIEKKVSLEQLLIENKLLKLGNLLLKENVEIFLKTKNVLNPNQKSLFDNEEDVT